MAEKKRNYNPKSRENLLQYKGPGEKKEDKLADRLKKIKLDNDVLKTIIPTAKIFKKDEQDRFLSLLELYLKEFAQQDHSLTMFDYRAIAQLCKNTILEDRLLAAAMQSGDDERAANYMSSMDKLKRENAKLEEHLAATRSVRVDPRAGQDVNILDLIVAYERDRRVKQKQIQRLREEEEAVRDQYRTSMKDLIT